MLSLQNADDEILYDDPLHNSSGSSTKGRVLYCRKCEGHGFQKILKGHGPLCPYIDCKCKSCDRLMRMRKNAFVRRYKDTVDTCGDELKIEMFRPGQTAHPRHRFIRDIGEEYEDSEPESESEEQPKIIFNDTTGRISDDMFQSNSLQEITVLDEGRVSDPMSASLSSGMIFNSLPTVPQALNHHLSSDILQMMEKTIKQNSEEVQSQPENPHKRGIMTLGMPTTMLPEGVSPAKRAVPPNGITSQPPNNMAQFAPHHFLLQQHAALVHGQRLHQQQLQQQQQQQQQLHQQQLQQQAAVSQANNVATIAAMKNLGYPISVSQANLAAMPSNLLMMSQLVESAKVIKQQPNQLQIAASSRPTSLEHLRQPSLLGTQMTMQDYAKLIGMGNAVNRESSPLPTVPNRRGSLGTTPSISPPQVFPRIPRVIPVTSPAARTSPLCNPLLLTGNGDPRGPDEPNYIAFLETVRMFEAQLTRSYAAELNKHNAYSDR